MTPAEPNRLVGILGRLGSDFDGERAAAGLLADRIVRSAGLTWADVLRTEDVPQPDRPSELTRGDAVRICNRWADYLTPWEDAFLEGIFPRAVLSPKQMQTLLTIAYDVQLRANQ